MPNTEIEELKHKVAELTRTCDKLKKLVTGTGQLTLSNSNFTVDRTMSVSALMKKISEAHTSSGSVSVDSGGNVTIIIGGGIAITGPLDLLRLPRSSWPAPIADKTRIFADTSDRILRELPSGEIEEMVCSGVPII